MAALRELWGALSANFKHSLRENELFSEIGKGDVEIA